MMKVVRSEEASRKDASMIAKGTKEDPYQSTKSTPKSLLMERTKKGSSVTDVAGYMVTVLTNAVRSTQDAIPGRKWVILPRSANQARSREIKEMTGNKGRSHARTPRRQTEKFETCIL